MNSRSLAWHAAIERNIDSPWDAEHMTMDPIVPFITHAVHPQIAGLIERLGVRRQLAPEELIFKPGEPVEQLILVKKGITAREVGQITNALAISPPGHFACGNLNFFTSHPCIGRYYAIVTSEIISVPQELVRRIIWSDPALARIMAIQLELCTLSDRMAFGSYAAISVDLRLKAFFIAWYRNYGQYFPEAGGEGWCVMPVSVQRKYLAAVINSSRVWLDKTFKDWKEKALYRVDGNFLLMRPSLLEPAYKWIVQMEEASVNPRPQRFGKWLESVAARCAKLSCTPYAVAGLSA